MSEVLYDRLKANLEALKMRNTLGSCTPLVVGAINKAKLKDIDHQANNSVMHEHRFRVADGFTAKSLDSGAKS